MPSLDYDQEVASFKEFYSGKLEHLQRAAVRFSNLIEDLLKDEVRLQSDPPRITSRIKKFEECIAKFDRKYRENLEQNQVIYSIKDKITDLIGLRAVCTYEDQIDVIVERIKNTVDGLLVIKTTDKRSEIREIDGQMGYQALHLDLRLDPARCAQAEYKPFADLQFELQIRTLIHDAWSDIDHKIKYKKDLPKSLKRRIMVLSALFELADREFVQIRDARNEWLQQRVEETTQQPLILTEFLEFLKQRFPTYMFPISSIENFYGELIRCFPNISIGYLNDATQQYVELVARYQSFLRISFKPYTTLRHILFLKDRKAFFRLLAVKYQTPFLEWCSQNQ